MNQAISRAIADEMRSDSSVVVWGEDVAAAGGVFKCTVDLLDEFGASRVRDTPISEAGFLGAAVGAAAAGIRPVVEIMFIEFLGVALDQLVTEAALFSYLSAGEYRVPLAVRASAGAGLGFGAQHSQMLDHWFVGTPGLKVAVVSDPQSGYDLTRASIRDDGPTLVIEPRSLYAVRGEVEAAGPVPPLGRARVLRGGDDVTIVTVGSTVAVAAEAAERLACDAEIIDLLTLWPWDQDQVLESVARTGRLAIVEESPRGSGWGAQVAAQAAADVFDRLKAPIVRVSVPDVPVPFSPPLEARFLPSVDDVVRHVDTLVSEGASAKPWWAAEEVSP